MMRVERVVADLPLEKIIRIERSVQRRNWNAEATGMPLL